MSGVLNAVVGAGGASAPTDAYFKNTTLLLHGDGTNGAQNNTFLDSSSNAFTITRNGNATQGTFSPFSLPDGQWSNYFNGSNYVTPPANAALAVGSGDFTLEAWVYRTTGGTYHSILEMRATTGDVSGYVFAVEDVAGAYLYNGTAGTIISSGNGTVPRNTWNHIAISRSGTTLRCFVNGSLLSTVTNSTNFSSTGPTVPYIGAGFNGASDFFYGYISNFRIVKGTAVYTSAFTPPTAPLTAITNTSLLTCQSNRFIDNSTNAFAITPSGSPSVQAYSPFAPTAAYSATTNGGSGYFDGSGDYLYTPVTSNTLLNGVDSTIEGWYYLNAAPGAATSGLLVPFINQGEQNCNWTLLADQTYIYFTGTNSVTYITASISVVPVKQWFHLAVVVTSGTSATMYINGTSVATGSIGSIGSSTAYNMNIGYSVAGGPATNNYLNGYASNVRVVKGSKVYTANFTPPTAPLTAITNTQLLLSCTNAGIKDNAAKNNLETVGNAQISTTQSKFGGSSMYFDGANSVLSLPSNPIPALGDFTIEGWFYSGVATTTAQYMFEFGANSNQSSFGTIAFGLGDTTIPTAASKVGLLASISGSSWAMNAISSSGVTSNNTWYHFAIVRNGGTFTVYLNGTSVITSTAIASTTALYSGTVNRIGALYYSTPFYYSGYIDDLRITSGVARYTSNFTVPSAAFPDK